MKSDLDLKTYEKIIYERIDLLIQHFHAVSDKLEDEEDVKSSIIDKFIDILDWDLGDPLEAKKEQKTEDRKRADYALKVDGKPKIYIEAKSLNKDLEKGFDKTSGDGKRTYVEQTVNYAYNSGISWALLTNGKRWILFNAYWKGTHKDRIAFDLEIDDFLKDNNFDKIKLLAKEYVVTGKLDEYFKDRPFRNPVDEEVVAFLLECRRALTESVIKNNEDKYTTDQLREGIHRILDRLVFYKICEDRDILDYNRIKKTFDIFREDKSSQSFVSGLKSYYDWFNKIYDGEMFSPHFCEDFIVDNNVYKMLVDGLYQYDFATIGADILGRIYENYLGNTLQELEKGLKWVIDSKERKRFGQYYTPQYVVDYIIDNVGITRNSKILDPACGSGAFLIKAYDKLKLLNQEYIKRISEKKKHNLSEENFKKWQKEELPKLESENINRILARNIHGVDLNPESVELTKVNLWLRSIQKDTPLNKLENNIACGNSLISGTEDELRKYFGDDWEEQRPFDWEEEFSEIMNGGGFDVVIGNPPYVRQEELSEIKSYLQKNYEVYHSMADLFVYFFEREMDMLTEGGYFGMIVSNKWLRAGYGINLRNFISKFWIEKFIDFGDLRVFPDATIYPCIIILRKINKSNPKIQVCKMETLSFDSLESYVEKNQFSVNQNELGEKEWSIQSANANQLLKKITSSGIELEKYSNSRIYRGILTGLNEAFVIDEKTKLELISEDPASAEIIKPIISGSEIKRYGIFPKSKYLIFIPWHFPLHKVNSVSGASKNAEILFKEQYPVIYNYLITYKEKLEKRNKVETGIRYEWYALQRCAATYYEEFEKPKIVWGNLATKASFAFDGSGFYVNAPACIFPTSSKYVLGIMNSKLMSYFLKSICAERRGGFIEQKPVYVSKIPIKQIPESQQKPIIKLVDRMLSLNKELQNININFFDYVNLRPKLKDTNLELYFNQLGMNDKKVLNNANGIKGKIRKVKAREEGGWLIVSVNYWNENKELVEDFDVLKCRFENPNFTKFIKHCILNYGKSISKGNILDRVLKIGNIPIFDNKIDVKNQQIIDEIMDSFLLATEWKEKIDKDIAETDKTIDQMVYKLYGLTEEEIKIVESST